MDRLDAMRLFVRVVDRRSFTQAAHEACRAPGRMPVPPNHIPCGTRMVNTVSTPGTLRRAIVPR